MNTAPRVKMADVAERAGVSVATVSKVLNRRYGVAPETIVKVQAIIDEMGYAENLSASSLRRSRQNMLGVLVADFEPFSAELLKGAARSVQGTDFEVLAHAGGDTEGWEKRSLARLGGTLMDGAVVVTPTVLDRPANVPVVAIDPHYGPQRIPTVDTDGYAGGKSVTAYLLSLGHRRIALLGGRAELDSARLREAGFRAAMADAGVAVDESLVRSTRYSPRIAEGEARALLSRGKDRPTAIFAANDITALRALSVAQEMGLDVPGDVSIAGFDDVPDAALCTPSLTTVRQPLQEMGQLAMSMLIDLVSGRTIEQHVRMDTTLVIRDSTAPPSK